MSKSARFKGLRDWNVSFLLIVMQVLKAPHFFSPTVCHWIMVSFFNQLNLADIQIKPLCLAVSVAWNVICEVLVFSYFVVTIRLIPSGVPHIPLSGMPLPDFNTMLFVVSGDFTVTLFQSKRLHKTLWSDHQPSTFITLLKYSLIGAEMLVFCCREWIIMLFSYLGVCRRNLNLSLNFWITIQMKGKQNWNQ